MMRFTKLKCDFKKRLCSATIKCFTSSDSWFSPSLNRAYSNRILHSSTAPSGMLISGTGGSNFPATTAELCTTSPKNHCPVLLLGGACALIVRQPATT